MTLSASSRIQGIELSGIRKVANMLSNYPNAINLTIGQPDFTTPELIKEAGIEAIRNDKTTYTPNMGILELRQAISNFFAQKYGFAYNPLTEICVTAGASGGMDATFRTILNEGDEIIIPAPIFSGYDPLISLTGAKAVYLDTTKTNFIPDPTQLEALITPKTKAVVSSPVSRRPLPSARSSTPAAAVCGVSAPDHTTTRGAALAAAGAARARARVSAAGRARRTIGRTLMSAECRPRPGAAQSVSSPSPCVHRAAGARSSCAQARGNSDVGSRSVEGARRLPCRR